tara:strand:- start:11 stop:526 length:516 start_codon:yes stop_codon:yes gene_type:complete
MKIKPIKSFTVVLEQEARYGETQVYHHTDAGLVYKLNDKLSLGGFYREIFEIKGDDRVREIRPHIDIFYKSLPSLKFRIRTEHQIKEISDDVTRLRVRPTYTYPSKKMVTPYSQTELFFTNKGFVRNRFNVGVNIRLNKISVKPGYMLQSSVKGGDVNNIHIFWVYVGLKI